jgi:hypothetical protein
MVAGDKRNVTCAVLRGLRPEPVQRPPQPGSGFAVHVAAFVRF